MMEYKTIKEELYDEIYRKYHNDVYKISLYYVKDADAAEDITQNVFFQFYMRFQHINRDCIKAYLIRAARNAAYNWIRDHKKELKGEYLDNIPEEHIVLHSAEDKYIMKERKKSVYDFTAKIMEELRQENESWYEVINMIYCLEKTHEATALELDMSKDVLYSKIYRAKRWLRKKFENEYRAL